MERSVLIYKLQTILNPLVKNYSTIGFFGEQKSCHGDYISWFEMFCRSAYGIIAYAKATSSKDYIHQFSNILLKVVRDKRYNSFTDYDQKAVELVPVITLLYLFREETWDTYSEEQRKYVGDYFNGIVNIKLCNNNWVFFRIIVCSILEKLTEHDYSSIIKHEWAFVDQLYQGNGWYRDGLLGVKDYYNAFAFHFYSLLYYYLFEKSERKSIIKERALLFADEYKYFFDTEGRSIPFGRSLIYRYATSSFWSMMLVNNLLSEEAEKEAIEILSKNYGWWCEQQIFDEHGFQSLGYAYPNDYMLESYNSSGSVYWSLKFFMILLANENSLIWKDTPRDNRTNEGIYCVANGDIIIQKGKLRSIAFINSYNGSGQAQDFAKYMHFAYNSLTGFNICKSENNFNYLSDDSSLIFNINGIKRKRTGNLFYTSKTCLQEFVWTIDDSIDIVSTVVPFLDFYLRIHVIRSKIACECYETGFPIKKTLKKSEEISDRWAVINSESIVSFIGLIRGHAIPLVINNESDSNIYFRETFMPSLRYDIKKGISVIVDYTGIISADVSFQDINDIKSRDIEIIDNTAIININDTKIRIPLYITNKVSRQIFIHKIERRINTFVIYLKRTIKRLI